MEINETNVTQRAQINQCFGIDYILSECGKNAQFAGCEHKFALIASFAGHVNEHDYCFFFAAILRLI